MSASVAGRVTGIFVKAGDNVVAGQKLAVLSDNLTNYGVNLDRTENAISRAQINYDSQVISLDKRVLDAQINVDKLESNLLALNQTSNQTILKAQNDVDNINPDKQWSKASLDIEKLDNTIERLELDYNNLLVSNQQNIDGLQSSFQNFFNGYTTIVADISRFGDELFGISELNRGTDDDYDIFLWADDKIQRWISRKKVVSIMSVQDSREYQDLYNQILNTQMTNTQILDGVKYISDGYDEIESLVNNLEITFNNSLISIGSLSNEQIAAFLAENNGYQAQYQANNSALVAFETNTNTFLNTYEASEESALKQIEWVKKDREILVETLENSTANAIINFENILVSQSDNVRNLEIQLKNARNNLENAQKNREVSLRSAANAITDASINHNEAHKNSNKLIITAPVSGTIGDVFIDIGQEIYSGNNILTLVSNGEREISLWFSSDEIGFVNTWDIVYLETKSQSYTWSIASLASVTDSNLNYKATVVFGESVDILGDLVSVYVLAENPYILLPVNIVEVTQPGTWFIKTFSWATIVNNEVNLWKIWWEDIEILSPLDAWVDDINE